MIFIKETTATRLRYIMDERNLKQIDILLLCEPYCKKYGLKIRRNDLSQDRLSIFALALNVNEVWLMGYNVPSDFNALRCDNMMLSSELQLSKEEEELLENYRSLNDFGQEDLLQESRDKKELTRYKKRDIYNGLQKQA